MQNSQMLEVAVTQVGGIYIDDVRITDRSTKPWAGSPAVDTFQCTKDALHATLIERGHERLIKKIDTPAFMASA